MNAAQEALQLEDRWEPHILILEDEANVAKGLQMVLSEEGYSAVELAMTGRRALESFDEKPFDLLIADLRLPDIDGIDVIRQVKQEHPATGVIVITGYSTVNSAVEAMKTGARDYLPKPFTDDEFMAAVRETLASREAAAVPLEEPAPPPSRPAEAVEADLQLTPEDPKRVEDLMARLQTRYAGNASDVIPLLQDVQQELGYLPENALAEIAHFTRQPAASIFGVATFYEQFRLVPAGRHIIRVCRGTACHVKGAERILGEIESSFRLVPGQTSDDRMFTLETVACFGSCAIAPVVVVDEKVQGRMNPSKTRECLHKLQDTSED